MRADMVIKLSVSLSLAALLSLSFGSHAGAQSRAVFSIPKLQCATAAARVTEAVSAIPGVIEAVDGDQSLRVIFDEKKTNVDAIKEALSRTDYPSEGDPVVSEEPN